MPLRGHGRKSHEEERRLADPGVAGDEHEARRDEAAAEHAVELGDAGRDPLGVGGLDLDEAEQAAGPAAGAPRTPGAGASARSSTSVPHSPHDGQRPSHFPVVYPHSEHACWRAAFAMGDPV